MIFEQIYLDALDQASYLVGSGTRAVVVDPVRDVDGYIERAARLGLEITDAIATHTHDDFVGGLRELEDRVGATPWLGEGFDGAMRCRRLRDGQVLTLGDVSIRALATPGHTRDGICLWLHGDGAPPRLLTGDTLRVGDVGRPDLGDGRADAMAALLHDSLWTKIVPLGDDVEVWPAHGARAVTGARPGRAPRSTIGAERVHNPALRCTDRAAFVAALLDAPDTPSAFRAHLRRLNRDGPRRESERPTLRELDELGCSVAAENGAVLLDVRPPEHHGSAHPENALNIGLTGDFEPWCAELIAPGRRIVLVADEPGQAREAWVRLGRVGHEAVIGFCRPVPERATARLPQVAPPRLADELRADRLQVVDVRTPPEFARGHVPGAVLAPLADLPAASLRGLDRHRPTALVSTRGERSSSAAWLMRQLGFRELCNAAGGTDAWCRAGYALET